ncbi:UNVERIFIED_CONTAM: hypothetical protein HDU68_005097 [Siphonaria sp. JEL0065]|nr:hypothetical protein HDU68_005097 [Siphonaria sp. JEL0065]
MGAHRPQDSQGQEEAAVNEHAVNTLKTMLPPMKRNLTIYEFSKSNMAYTHAQAELNRTELDNYVEELLDAAWDAVPKKVVVAKTTETLKSTNDSAKRKSNGPNRILFRNLKQ